MRFGPPTGGQPFKSKTAMRFSPKISQKIRALPLGALVTAAVIAAAFGFSLAVNLPGHLSYDSVIQLYEGRTGAYNGWHPPVMSWLLGLFDAVVPGTALFVAFDTLLLYGAMLSLIFVQKRASFAAAVVALLAAALPQFLLYPGIIWKDVLFAHATVAGFVALALAAAHWQQPRLRMGLIAVSTLFLALATLARQNGVLILIVGAAALGWIAATQVAERKRREALVYGGGLLVVAALVIFGANAGLSLRAEGDSATVAQLRLLQIYDIVGMRHADPSLALPVLQTREPALAAEVVGDGVKAYTPTRNDTLIATPKFVSALADSEPSNVFAQWRELLVSHPWLYVKVRSAEFWQVFATPDVAKCMPYKVGIDGPPDKLRALGMSERDDDRDDALNTYAYSIQSTPAFSHVVFFLLGSACCGVLLRRRRAADLAIASLFAGMTVFAASFFVISIACDYRYLYGIDLAAVIALFYLALDPMSVWQTLKAKKAGI
jgi:hypothetical protein